MLPKEGFKKHINIYSEDVINELRNEIDHLLSEPEQHYIRQLCSKSPKILDLLWNQSLSTIFSEYGLKNFFLTKSIYFNKTSNNNWFVPFHQDLSISVAQKMEAPGYKNWTFKKGQHGVEPPLEILKSIITCRVYLDDADETNGAMQLISESHMKGVIRDKTLTQEPYQCRFKAGDVLLMSPLTLHSSSRSKTLKPRRVIHLEFSNTLLPEPLNWLEHQTLHGYKSD